MTGATVWPILIGIVVVGLVLVGAAFYLYATRHDRR